MKCPNCQKTGNFLKRIFSRHDKEGIRSCLNCGFKIKFTYVWKKIAILCLAVFILLIIINYIMQEFGYPGLTSTMAGGLAALIIGLSMQKPPFLTIENISKIKKNKDTK